MKNLVIVISRLRKAGDEVHRVRRKIPEQLEHHFAINCDRAPQSLPDLKLQIRVAGLHPGLDPGIAGRHPVGQRVPVPFASPQRNHQRPPRKQLQTRNRPPLLCRPILGAGQQQLRLPTPPAVHIPCPESHAEDFRHRARRTQKPFRRRVRVRPIRV